MEDFLDYNGSGFVRFLSFLRVQIILPAIINIILIEFVFDEIFEFLSKKLTHFENHKYA
jgi:hypothetical protein